MGLVSSVLCHVVGFAYPIFATYKAIESDDKGDDTQWLTYWVVYSFFSVMETILDTFIFWVPFYYELKLVFLVALQLPQIRLSEKLYNTYIKPKYSNFSGGLDSFISKALSNMKRDEPTPVAETVTDKSE
eukprot:TRINITY_DN129536_c0_g1_i2.p1 TRINITY_DN129536_c0_g1~~TRINITY_DN129536_c0_g1_i2.p1  ORF type:complete len:130 (-),score=15.24 TRINITY_DN129536_c0_g1_i2:17-406(-)